MNYELWYAANATNSSYQPPSNQDQTQLKREQLISLIMTALVLLSQFFQWFRKVKKSKCWGVEIDMRSEGSSSSEEITPRRTSVTHDVVTNP